MAKELDLTGVLTWVWCILHGDFLVIEYKKLSYTQYIQ